MFLVVPHRSCYRTQPQQMVHGAMWKQKKAFRGWAAMLPRYQGVPVQNTEQAAPAVPGGGCTVACAAPATSAGPTGLAWEDGVVDSRRGDSPDTRGKRP